MHKRLLGVFAALVGAVAAMLLAFDLGPAKADGTFILDQTEDGCFTARSYGTGLLGDGTGRIDIPPGPGKVLGAWIEWVGADDLTPNDVDTTDGRADSELEIDGTTVVGVQPEGEIGWGTFSTKRWHVWTADIGPKGTGVITTPTAYSLEIAGWDTAENEGNNGATVTVLYDYSPCAADSRVVIKSGIDVYWWGDLDDGAFTDLLVFPVDKKPYERSAQITLTHAGSDASQTECRGKAVWMATGEGEVPVRTGFNLVSNENPSGAGFGINGGVEILNDPFTDSSKPCVPSLNPAPDVPYEDGHPYPGGAIESPYRATGVNRVTGGDLGAEWGVIDVRLLIPAEADWVAFQLESEADQDGESGAWGGGATLEIAQAPTGIDLELTKGVSTSADGPFLPEVGPLEPGATIFYRVGVQNVSPGPASGVIVRDPLPAGISMVRSNAGASFNRATGRWFVGTINGNTEAALIIEATADREGDIVNVAEIQSANERDIDSVPGNGPQDPAEDDNSQALVRVVRPAQVPTTTEPPAPTTTTTEPPPPTTTTTEPPPPTTTTAPPTTTTTAPPTTTTTQRAFVRATTTVRAVPPSLAPTTTAPPPTAPPTSGAVAIAPQTLPRTGTDGTGAGTSGGLGLLLVGVALAGVVRWRRNHRIHTLSV